MSDEINNIFVFGHGTHQLQVELEEDEIDLAIKSPMRHPNGDYLTAKERVTEYARGKYDQTLNIRRMSEEKYQEKRKSYLDEIESFEHDPVFKERSIKLINRMDKMREEK